MDHIWDGFYTGQKRLQRFPVLVRANTGNFHNIDYTGTPPLSQLFEIYGSEANDKLKLRLQYSNNDLVVVEVGGNEVASQPLNNGTPQEITGTVCGENRWMYGVNRLEFTLLHGCSVTLKTKQSLALSFRIEMTVT